MLNLCSYDGIENLCYTIIHLYHILNGNTLRRAAAKDNKIRQLRLGYVYTVNRQQTHFDKNKPALAPIEVCFFFFVHSRKFTSAEKLVRVFWYHST